MDPEHVKLLNRYYRERDDVERIILWAEIKEKEIDYLSYFHEECCFCGKETPLRHCQQIVLYDIGVSYKRQNQWPGSLAFRCHTCRDKKQKLALEIRNLQVESVRCLRDDGFIEDFEKYEIYLNLLTAKRTKTKMMDKAINGLVLSHLDNVTDFTIPLSAEKAKKEIANDGIIGFLSREWWRPAKGRR